MCCENDGISTKEMIKIQAMIRDNIYAILEVKRSPNIPCDIIESCDEALLIAIESLAVGIGPEDL